MGGRQKRRSANHYHAHTWWARVIWHARSTDAGQARCRLCTSDILRLRRACRNTAQADRAAARRIQGSNRGSGDTGTYAENRSDAWLDRAEDLRTYIAQGGRRCRKDQGVPEEVV